MKTIQNLPLATFLRYGFVGLIAVGLFLIVPLAILSPHSLLSISTFGGVSGLVLAALSMGFLLDAMKIYQLIPGYSKSKSEFFNEIAVTLGVSDDDALELFYKAMWLEKEHTSGEGIFYLHARWVMINILASLFISAGVLWIVVGLWHLVAEAGAGSYFALTGAVSLLTGGRLVHTEKQERHRVDKAYIRFCKENRSWVLAPQLAEHDMALEEPENLGRQRSEPGVVHNTNT